MRAVRHARGKKGPGEPLNAKLLTFAELGPSADLSRLDITKMGQDTRCRLRDPPSLVALSETVGPSLGAAPATHASGPVSMFHWPDRGPSFFPRPLGPPNLTEARTCPALLPSISPRFPSLCRLSPEPPVPSSSRIRILFCFLEKKGVRRRAGETSLPSGPVTELLACLGNSARTRSTPVPINPTKDRGVDSRNQVPRRAGPTPLSYIIQQRPSPSDPPPATNPGQLGILKTGGAPTRTAESR